MKSAAVEPGLAVMVVLSLAGPRAIADGESTETLHGLWLCQNAPIKETAYFAGIFEATADRRTVIQSFQTMLAAKYGYHGNVSCGVGRGVGEAESTTTFCSRMRQCKLPQRHSSARLTRFARSALRST